MKSAYAVLAAARLAVTAETGELLALEEIIDISLSSMPLLAAGHHLEAPPTSEDSEGSRESFYRRVLCTISRASRPGT